MRGRAELAAACAPQALSFNAKITKDTKMAKVTGRADRLGVLVSFVIWVSEEALTRLRG